MVVRHNLIDGLFDCMLTSLLYLEISTIVAAYRKMFVLC